MLPESMICGLDAQSAGHVLTLDGEVDSLGNSSEADVLRVYKAGKYSRKFTLSQVIDQSRIDAEIKNGVLKLRLPKVETATPRKISVKAA